MKNRIKESTKFLKNKDSLRLFLNGLFGAVSACILVFALFAINYSLFKVYLFNIFLFLTFLFLSLSRVLLSLPAFYESNKVSRIKIIKNIAFSVVYLAAAIISLIIKFDVALIVSVGVIYFASVVANRICIMFEKRTIGSFVFNSFISIVAVFMAAILITAVGIEEEEVILLLAVAVLFSVIFVSLCEVLGYAFSKIQLKGLLKIIRETYIFEILYGLIILMITFSFYFYLMEPGVTSFGDGLWYSFAIITTIGFGDVVVTGVVGRILSVILGIYGIIVVASITSVIVNYYNEVTRTKDSHKEIEQKEDSKEEPSEDNK